MNLSLTSLNLWLAGAIVALIALLLLFGDVPLSGAMWLDALIHWKSVGAEIVWGIRLPRNLAAAGVGAMLGMSGALMQGLLRNPLAEPGLLGVSAGAGLGAAVAIVLGLGLIDFAVAGFALIGAVIVAVILLVFVERFPQRQSLILLGVGLSALCGALMALTFNLSPSPVTTAEMLGWMMGSVENRNIWDVLMCVIGLALAGALSFRLARGLRYLTLGEETARSMGVDMTRLTQAVVIGSSLLLLGIFIAETFGVQRTLASNAAFLISLCVVLTPLAEWAWLGRAPRPVEWTAAGMSLAGAFMIGGGTLSLAPGDALMVLAALLRALNVCMTKRAMQSGRVPALTLTAVQSGVVAGGCLLLAWCIGRGQWQPLPSFSAHPSFWGYVGYLVLGCTLFAFFVQNYAVRRSSATRVALLMGSEPVFGALFACIWLGERLTVAAWLGGALIVAASLLATVRTGHAPIPQIKATAT